MANLCTEATNLLKFCMACSDGLDLPLGAGASDVGCGAGEGRIYTWSVEGAIGSGHLVAWAVAVGFSFKGIG